MKFFYNRFFAGQSNFLYQNNDVEVNTESVEAGGLDETHRVAALSESSHHRLALQVSASAGPSLTVKPNDELGKIVKKLTGSVNWAQEVDYRSGKLSGSQKPSVLSQANKIYPGQHVWIENGRIVVSDHTRSGGSAPAYQPSQKPSAGTRHRVKSGDQLGDIMQQKFGGVNWSQGVDYRSSKLSGSQKPTRLSDADLIYPGQYIWVENGTIVVAETAPGAGVTPAPVTQPRVQPNPGRQPVQPNPRRQTAPIVQPQPGPSNAPAPYTGHLDVSPPRTTVFQSLTREERSLLGLLEVTDPHDPNYKEFGRNDSFERRTFKTSNLPEGVSRILAATSGVLTIPATVPFLVSKDFVTGGTAGHISRFNRRITNPRIASLIYVDASAGGGRGSADTLKGVAVTNEDYTDALLNEFSHLHTTRLVEAYAQKVYAKLRRQGASVLPDKRDLEAQLRNGFNHSDLPGGIYDFDELNELQSDAFSFSTYPEGVTGRYSIYGQNPKTPTGNRNARAIPGGYKLNRDFTAHHLAKFLQSKGYGNPGMHKVNEAFRSYHNAVNTQGAGQEANAIAQKYHFYDPEFFAYIQPKYQAVGEAFYAHLARKIQSV